MAYELAARNQLGRELRKARKAAKLTQNDVATRLEWSQPRLTRIETKLVSIDPGDLEALMELYELPDDAREHLRKLLSHSGAAPVAGVPSFPEYIELLACERQASDVWALSGDRIPNLLQSERYLYDQYTEAGDLTPVELLVQRRAEREAILTGPNPPQYRIVLSESALYRLPGGWTRKRFTDEVQYLLSMMDKYPSRLHLQVATRMARIAHWPMDFTILKIAGEIKLYLESGIGSGKFQTRERDIDRYRDLWPQISAAALTVDQTRTYLRQLLTTPRPLEGMFE